MSTQRDLHRLAELLAAEFNFGSVSLSSDLICIFNTDTKEDICRLELLHHPGDPEKIAGGLLGLAFHIEIISSDGVLILQAAQRHDPAITLLNCYYVASDGKNYIGLDAYVRSEADKEGKTRLRILEELEMQRIEEWEMQRRDRLGKAQVH